jgi:rfaE bifunctional protein nucleotidyltransferase chain/domain
MMFQRPPWLEKKWLDPENIEERIGELRRGGKTLATLNGSFDLLHAGHLYILHQASLQADILVVALNSDRSIQAYKSPKRPIISLEHRLSMMAALTFVDYVTSFEETDPCALLAKIRPDVHVNGAEYGLECIEAKTVLAHGGRIHLVDRVASLATSEVIKKVFECV